MKPIPPPPRHLPFRGAVNFRDLGGYHAGPGRRVRFGQLFRSDSLCSLDAGDLGLLDSLGLKSICDFRVQGERRLRPDRMPDGHRISVHDFGLLPRGSREMWQALIDRCITRAALEALMREHYQLFVLEHSERFRQLFDLLLTEGSLPMLIHCASGKDRTGFAVSLIQTALGMSWQDIVADYLVSDRFRRDLAQIGPRDNETDALEGILQAHPEYLGSAYDTIREKWQTTDRYLEEALGLTPPRREALRERLLEDVS